jgi:hypothetical protein
LVDMLPAGIRDDPFPAGARNPPRAAPFFVTPGGELEGFLAGCPKMSA